MVTGIERALWVTGIERTRKERKKNTQQNTNTNTEYGAIWMRLYVYVHTFYLLCYRIKIRECSRYARLADLFFIMFVFFKYLFAFISKKKKKQCALKHLSGSKKKLSLFYFIFEIFLNCLGIWTFWCFSLLVVVVYHSPFPDCPYYIYICTRSK